MEGVNTFIQQPMSRAPKGQLPPPGTGFGAEYPNGERKLLLLYEVTRGSDQTRSNDPGPEMLYLTDGAVGNGGRPIITIMSRLGSWSSGMARGGWSHDTTLRGVAGFARSNGVLP